MSRCTKCGTEVSVLYMCDLDEEDGEYCADCFEELGCEEEHEEGCMTQVLEAGDVEPPEFDAAWDEDEEGEDEEEET